MTGIANWPITVDRPSAIPIQIHSRYLSRTFTATYIKDSNPPLIFFLSSFHQLSISWAEIKVQHSSTLSSKFTSSLLCHHLHLLGFRSITHASYISFQITTLYWPNITFYPAFETSRLTYQLSEQPPYPEVLVDRDLDLTTYGPLPDIYQYSCSSCVIRTIIILKFTAPWDAFSVTR